MKMITFNVGGKQYKTTISTLIPLKSNNDLLNMLVRNNSGENGEVKENDEVKEMNIFIDRDHKLFRWILYYYRSGGKVVTPETAQVQKDVWEAELLYYGLPSTTPRTKLQTDIDRILQKHIEEKKIIRKKQRKEFDVLIEGIMNNGGLKTVFSVYDNGQYDTDNHMTYQGVKLNNSWFQKNKRDFEDYIEEITDGKCSLEFEKNTTNYDTIIDFPPGNAVKYTGLSSKTVIFLKIAINI